MTHRYCLSFMYDSCLLLVFFSEDIIEQPVGFTYSYSHYNGCCCYSQSSARFFGRYHRTTTQRRRKRSCNDSTKSSRRPLVAPTAGHAAATTAAVPPSADASVYTSVPSSRLGLNQTAQACQRSLTCVRRASACVVADARVPNGGVTTLDDWRASSRWWRQSARRRCLDGCHCGRQQRQRPKHR